MSAWRRVRQFARAMRARVTADDLAFMESYVPERARPLFLAMHEADQRHALNVARTAREMAAGQDADLALLTRAALLHDVGRERGMLNVWGKVAAVLLAKLPLEIKERPEIRHFWERPGFILYVSRHHGELGARKLAALGLTQEAEMARLHHAPEHEDDSEELKLLRRADELN